MDAGKTNKGDKMETGYYDCVDTDFFLDNSFEYDEQGRRIKPFGAVQLLEDDELHNGAPFEFDPRMTEVQALSLKKALWIASDDFWLINADVKADFTEEMILETIDLAIRWYGEPYRINLLNKTDFNDFVDTLVCDVIPSMKQKFNLIERR